MRKLIYLFIISLYYSGFSQPESKYGVPVYYSNYTNTILNPSYQPTTSDTCFYVVSTRNYFPNKQEFLDYDYDTSATLKYFAVYVNGHNWNVVPYKTLNSLLDLKPIYKDFVVFTEGLGKTFNHGIERATTMLQRYDIDELFFDWPTERPYLKRGKDIRLTHKVSEQIAKPYAQFLEEFQMYKNSHPEKFKTTTLLFHSMGNLILMHALKKDLFKNIQSNLLDNVVLNAPCVNQKNHYNWLSKLSISKKTFVTINDNDRNLNGAKLLFMAHQLGERPKPNYCKNVHYVDFSEILNKEHNYFLMEPLLTQKPEIKQFYINIFKGNLPQLKFIDKSISEEVKKYLPQKSEVGIMNGM